MESCLEWLETNGQGGYAMGSVDGVLRRKYHSLFTAAQNPPVNRNALLKGFEIRVTVGDFTYLWAPFVYSAEDQANQGSETKFSRAPWPKYTISFRNNISLTMEICSLPKAVMAVRIKMQNSANTPALLSLRPFFSGLSHHQLRQNTNYDNFRYDFEKLCLSGEPDIAPTVAIMSNARFSSSAWMNYNVYYEEEEQRGYPCRENLYTPGEFIASDLSEICLLVSDSVAGLEAIEPDKILSWCNDQMKNEAARRNSLSSAESLAEKFLVHSANRSSIIAGYPWFADWGRDTFISLRGICLAQNKLKAAEDILLSWATTINQGQLPNCFSEQVSQFEYNSVDASLWYVICVWEYLYKAQKNSHKVPRANRKILLDALENIITSYYSGTNYNIACDSDGLLRAGNAHDAITWMDAKVNGVPVTSRAGKAVEIQCLWINALIIAEDLLGLYAGLAKKARESFNQKFWNESENCLYDVIDCNGIIGAVDPSIRPNQIFAVGGLPGAVLDDARSRLVVDKVQEKLLTTYGLRTLDPQDPAWVSTYAGSQEQRDLAYHQGTIWPWLLGPFLEAWLRCYGSHGDSHDVANQLLSGIYEFIDNGMAPEIFGGCEQQEQAGCPFQAWTVAEVLRAEAIIKQYRQSRRRKSFLSVLIEKITGRQAARAMI